MPKSTTPTQTAYEAATVYLLPEHQIILDEVRLKLRRHGIKATKSKLVRIAIKLLNERTADQIIQIVQFDQGE